MNLETELLQEGYSEAEAREIVRRAARLQSESGDRMSQATLEESAAEAGISREWIQQAARQVQAERAAVGQRRRTVQRVAAVVAVVLALFLWVSYSTLNAAETRVEAARAQIETVLQRRFDLVPELLKVTREYAAQERQLYETIAAARSRFQRAGTLAEKGAANAQLQQALPQLQALAESNPQFRSSELYLRLQDELAGSENRIAVERRRYNQAVADYNQTARSFPMLLVRPLFGYPAQEPYFQAAPEAQQPPKL